MCRRGARRSWETEWENDSNSLLEQFTIGCILAHLWHGHLARVHGLEGRATRSQPFVKCSSRFELGGALLQLGVQLCQRLFRTLAVCFGSPQPFRPCP